MRRSFNPGDTMADADFQVAGTNAKALFALLVHRGEGMALLGMNWKKGRPPRDFVGFAIEYREPGGDRFYPLNNRLGFDPGKLPKEKRSTRLSPLQKFRWVHFPRNAELEGAFVYRVTPVFMDAAGTLSYGEFQQASLRLARETYPGALNVSFTRGFVSSQAFVDKFGPVDAFPTLLPPDADLDFEPTHERADEAFEWMGFEARRAVLALLDAAVKDTTAEVKVVAYELCVPEVVERLLKLAPRLSIIIDDSAGHADATSAESLAAARLAKKGAKVARQKMGGLQHNKTIAVGGKVQTVLCGSTNFSWRGFFVQNNNALVITGKKAFSVFSAAFDAYLAGGASGFKKSPASKGWQSVSSEVDVKIAFSPHAAEHGLLAEVAEDLDKRTKGSLLYSLAFLYQTPGPIRKALKKHTEGKKVFVYGISDKDVNDIQVTDPDGSSAPVRPAALVKNVPEPFKAEAKGGSGVRLHHKFIVIDFHTPDARVYLGSYNFSSAADKDNGDNLVLIRDRRVATSYAIEAVRIFDHYSFRLKQEAAKQQQQPLVLKRPPPTGKPTWFDEDWTDSRKARDRTLFCPLK